MHVSLRVSDRNVMRSEEIGDAKPQIAANFSQHLFATNVGPEVEVEDQGVVTEVVERNARRRFGLDLRLLLGGSVDEFFDLAHRRSVCDANAKHRSDLFIHERPVDDCALEHDAVGNEHVYAIHAPDARRAIADKLDRAL